MLDPIQFYSPETSVFPELAIRFAATGRLTGEELYLILDWKAPRARTKYRDRLTKKERTFGQAAEELGRALHGAETDEQRLGLLLGKEWGFALPTATAVLTVLYPDRFTMYDVRVCEVLKDFDKLGDRAWSSETWREYQRFVGAVRSAIREDGAGQLNLRDADRWLWGKSKRDKLRSELSIGECCNLDGPTGRQRG